LGGEDEGCKPEVGEDPGKRPHISFVFVGGWKHQRRDVKECVDSTLQLMLNNLSRNMEVHYSPQ
jgi:ATP-dependent 26S proteasome regulatory subunit